MPGVSNDVSESSSLKEFHDDPEFVLDEIAVVHLDDVGVVVVTHNHNLKPQKASIRPYQEFGIFITD